MEKNKLKRFWGKIKDKLSDPELKVYKKILKTAGYAVVLSAVGYIGYKVGYGHGAAGEFKTDMFLLGLANESGFIAIDTSKANDFKELCNRRLIKK